MKKLNWWYGAAACALAAQAQGALIFDSSIEFSGATAPAGPAPWIRTTITNAGIDTVTIKFENLNLVGSEFVAMTTLNLDPALNAANLLFSAPLQVGTFSPPTIGLGTDAFKADGDGFFDIRFSFSNSNPQRFGPGESIEYTVTGIVGLDESDFDFLSVGGPVGNNGYPVAAHVQGIGGSGQFSGWVTVPAPGAAALLGFAGMLARRRRR